MIREELVAAVTGIPSIQGRLPDERERLEFLILILAVEGLSELAKALVVFGELAVLLEVEVFFVPLAEALARHDSDGVDACSR